MAQVRGTPRRKVRRLCSSCSKPDTLEDLQSEFQYLLVEEDCSRLRRAVGCPDCRHTGYRGRSVVPELLLVTPDMQRAIARGADVSELTSLARQAGMRTLWEAGLERVIDGTTSLHELLDNIAAPLVENHGAQSAVDALLEELRTGAGSQDPGPAPKVVHRVGSGNRSIPAAKGVGPGERKRVLVVDERWGNRRTLRAQLEAADFAVLEAADGEAALAYVRRLRPDIVLTDIAMPKLDAVGLLQALAQEPDPPAVVVCTEQNDQELLQWLLELGALEVVPAPLDAALLLRCVQSRLAGAA